MLCSLQWKSGRTRPTWRSLSWRKENSASGLGPVAGHDVGDRPVVVVGDQDVLAEQFFFQFCSGGGVDGPGQAQLGGLVAGQFPDEHAPDPGVLGDGSDVLFDLVAGSAGASAARVAPRSVQLAGGLGQGGALEPGDLGGVQFLGVSQDRPPGDA